MTDPNHTNDDWLENQTTPPKPVGAPSHQAAPKPTPKPKARLAAALKSAPKVADARPAPKAGPDDAPFPDPDAEPAGPRDGEPARPKGQIWEGCPVKPLGVNGDLSYYLDRHGQLREVKKHDAQTIQHLFGHQLPMLIRRYPTYLKGSDTPQRNRFDATTASMEMIKACSEKGLFNPDGAVRGVGAWADDNGAIVYHTGQELHTATGTREPAEIDGKIYPAYPPIPAPAASAAAGDVAAQLLDTLESWAWHKPDVAPMLALGMIAAQMLGGALDWRPVYWITGDKATGKSTFHDLLKHLHGKGGLVQSSDPTKSGITSVLGHSSLPVAIDELEPGDENSHKERDIITLARVAASGGQWLRGSADQKGARGNVYSTFLFSSILIPGAMGPQDRSRLIILSLDTLAEDAAKPAFDPRTWRERGARLKRLLIERWTTWHARLELWRAALAEAGLGGRNGDNYATTLALADMVLSAEMPAAEDMAAWARKVAFAARSETDEIGSDAEDMLVFLIGQPFDVFRRGEQYTIAQWLMAAGELPASPKPLVASLGGGEGDVSPFGRAEVAKAANEKLAKAGLRVRGTGDAAELFIPNTPVPGLCKLFEKSRWAGGVWKQSAHRVPGASPVPQPLSIAGQRLRGVYLPFKAIGGLLSFPMDRAAEASPEARSSQDHEDFA